LAHRLGAGRRPRRGANRIRRYSGRTGRGEIDADRRAPRSIRQQPERPTGVTSRRLVLEDFWCYSMLVGRAFDADEANAAVLSYHYWTRRFNRDPAIVGQTFRLDEKPFTVIGVASDGFQGTGVRAADIWIPLSVNDRRNASRGSVVALIVKQGMRLIAIGGFIGIALAAAAGISSFSRTAALFLVSGFLACYIP